MSHTAAMSRGSARARIVRVAATIQAVQQSVLLVVGLIQPEEFSLTLAQVATIGGIQVAVQWSVALLPWHELAQRRSGRIVLLANVWTSLVGLVVALSLANAVDVGILWLLAALLVYSAVVLPLRDHAIVALVGLVAAIGDMVVGTAEVGSAGVVVRLVALTAVAALTGVASAMAARRLDAEERARAEAQDAAQRLEAVARAGRSLASPATSEVLEQIADAATELGWTVVTVETVRGDQLEARTTRGIREPARLRPLDTVTGLRARALDRQTQVVTHDYPSEPWASEAIVAAGVRSAVAVPIWRDGTVTGVLAVGSPRPGPVPAEEVLAAELLAGLAERALDASYRLEAEAATIARLRELDQLKQDFVATVSHELRTPLTVITGLTETLLARWDDTPDEVRRQLMTRLDANAQALEEVIATLLDVARLERGELSTRLEPFDASATATQVLTRLEPLLASHPTTSDIAPNLRCRGDDRLVSRVLENLLTNALRHTPEGTAIHVSLRPEGHQVRFEVRDVGPGMDAETLAHVGERFRRGSDISTRGLGLGLALASEILRLHGSALGVRSTPGSGAIFSFVLPSAPSADEDVSS